jgi:hypothetical protein
MVKYILLESVVPVTFDFGFRSSGYRVVEQVELDSKQEIPKDFLSDALMVPRQKKKK